MEQTETEFLEKPKINNAAAFEELFKTYYKPLCSYARYYLKDPDESEEVVQGMFMQLWEKKDSTRITTSVKSYLYSSVRNNCLNRIKHMKIRSEHREHVLKNSDKSSDTVMDKVIGKELEQQITSAIEGLPEQCGLIFRLSRHGDLKYAEIAEHLDLSVKTVENQMGKALRVLREKLNAYLVPMAVVFIHYLNG